MLILIFFGRQNPATAKIQIKALIKNGKPPYSPHSVLTFYEDCFTEETEDIKTEILI